MGEVRRSEDWRESVSYEELQVQCIADCSEVMVGTSKDKLEVCRVFVEGPKRYVPNVQRAGVSTKHKAGWRLSSKCNRRNSRSSPIGARFSQKGSCNWRMQRDLPGR